MEVYKVFMTRKMLASDDSESLHQAEGERIHRLLRDTSYLGVFILDTEFDLTINRVKRLERFFGSVFDKKVEVIY